MTRKWMRTIHLHHPTTLPTTTNKGDPQFLKLNLWQKELDHPLNPQFLSLLDLSVPSIALCSRLKTMIEPRFFSEFLVICHPPENHLMFMFHMTCDSIFEKSNGRESYTRVKDGITPQFSLLRLEFSDSFPITYNPITRCDGRATIFRQELYGGR